MPTTVTKSIGTSSRDYSTLQAWEDACPASLVTDDKIWRGECYNDSEFTGTLIISGMTTDSTRYVELTAASGQSFQDHASVRSNALYYNQSNGVGIACNTASTTAILNSAKYTRISRIQLKQSAASYALKSNPSDGGRFTDLIIQHSGSSNFAVMLDGSASPVIANTLIYCTASNNGGLQLYSCGSPLVTNCTISVGTTDYDIINQSTNATVKNTAVFTSASNKWLDTSSLSGCGYNCTNHSSAWGSNNQVSKTASNQFENSSTDFRLKSGADCIDHGNTDSTYAPNDISGTVRGTTTSGDIGAWEYTSAGETGTISATEAADTAAISGNATGTVAATESADTAAVVGSATGTVAATEAADTAALAGNATGTIAATEAADTADITDATETGTIAATEAGDVALIEAPVSDTEFAEWLAADLGERAVLVELGYKYQTGSAGSSVVNDGTIYLGTAPYHTTAAETPASKTYLDVIRALPSFSRSISKEQLGGRYSASYGTLELDNTDRSLDFLFDVIQDGCDVTFYLGDAHWERSDFRQIFVATQDKISAPSRDRIAIALRDRGRLLNAGIVGDDVGGTGEEATRPQPLIYGTVYNYEPIVEDSSTLKYRWIGNWDATAAILGLRDNGLALYVDQGSQGSYTPDDVLLSANLYADAAADTFTISNSYWSPVPEDGEVITFSGTPPGGITAGTQYWVVNKSGATFKVSTTKGGSAVDITSSGYGWLGGAWTATRSSFYDNGDGTIVLSNAPSGRLTMDASGESAVATAAEVMEDLVANGAGLGAGAIGGAHGSYSGLDPDVGLLITDRANILDLLDDVARSAAAWYAFDRDNTFVYGHVRPDSIPGSSQRTFYRGDVLPGTLRLDRLRTAYKTTRCRYKRNWTPQDQLSSSVTAYNAAYYRSEGYPKANTAPTDADDYADAPWNYHTTMIDGDLVDTLIKSAADAATWISRVRTIFLPWVEFLEFQTTLAAYALELGDKVTTDFDDVSGLTVEYDPTAFFGLTGSITWQVLGISLDLGRGSVGLTLVRRRTPAATTVV